MSVLAESTVDLSVVDTLSPAETATKYLTDNGSNGLVIKRESDDCKVIINNDTIRIVSNDGQIKLKDDQFVVMKWDEAEGAYAEVFAVFTGNASFPNKPTVDIAPTTKVRTGVQNPLYIRTSETFSVTNFSGASSQLSFSPDVPDGYHLFAIVGMNSSGTNSTSVIPYRYWVDGNTVKMYMRNVATSATNGYKITLYLLWESDVMG